MAYLLMMAIRLVELHRVLKDTGSIYLHCDPTAGHYLKLVMDAVFGYKHFRSEIVWKRTFAHSSANRAGPVHDILFLYSKTDDYIWIPQYQEYDPFYLETFLDQIDNEGRRYMRVDLTGAGISKGESGKPWRGIDVMAKGRHWAYTQETLEKLDSEGKVHWPKKAGGMPRLKRYKEDLSGVLLQDVWTDIRPMHNLSAERLGFPTQKPETLLERIIKASSNENDLIMDPFCGCGTTITVAQRLKRKWIGIDITHLAISLMRHRLKDSFGQEVEYEVIGEPIDLRGAGELAKQDPYQFEWWALGLVGARPAESEKKKGKDKGIDGYIYFHDEPQKTKKIVIQVKSGHVNPGQIRDLRGVIEREKAQIGVFITFQEPTQGMRTEAVSAGFYRSPGWNKDYSRIQILTIKELLEGKRIDYPPKTSITFKKAKKHEAEEHEQLILDKNKK